MDKANHLEGWLVRIFTVDDYTPKSISIFEHSPSKLMVGRRSFPCGMVNFLTRNPWEHVYIRLKGQLYPHPIFILHENRTSQPFDIKDIYKVGQKPVITACYNSYKSCFFTPVKPIYFRIPGGASRIRPWISSIRWLGGRQGLGLVDVEGWGVCWFEAGDIFFQSRE